MVGKDIKENSLQKEPTLMKSKHRVQKHGEVFTPGWVVDKMTAIPGIKEKAEDVFATFLEPSAGEGAFLLAIEELKLRFVSDNYGKDLWDQYALWALSSIYGIEFLEDNLTVVRQRMIDLFSDYYEAVHDTMLFEQADLYKSARAIIWANVVQGNTITHKNNIGEEIVFSHWKPMADSLHKVLRLPFTYSSLFEESHKNEDLQLTLFDMIEQLNFLESIDRQNEETTLKKYMVVEIDQVWREEQEHV